MDLEKFDSRPPLETDLHAGKEQSRLITNWLKALVGSISMSIYAHQ